MRKTLLSPNPNFILFSLFLLCASWNLYALNDSKAVSPGPDDYVINFGLYGKSDKGYFIEKQTHKIPYVTREQGQIFGATIQPINKNSYEFYSIFYLPGVPQKLGEDALSSSVVDELGKILRSPVYKATGISALPIWLDEGDPVGEYKVEIYINNELIKTIEFEVVKEGK